MNKTKQAIIKVADIKIDGGTQQRERIDPETVAEYAEAMRCGSQFPPVVVFSDGVHYWLADGFHRFHARREVPAPEVLADIHIGTQRDAILYSTGANNAHGLRPSNADKRKAVGIMLADKEWTQWSDNQIAKHCKVTHPFVGKLRKEMQSEKTDGVVTVTSTPPKAAPILAVEKEEAADNVVQFNAEQEDFVVGYEAEEKKQSAAPAQQNSEEADALREQLAELSQNLTDTIADNESLARVWESDDKIVASLAEAKRYREQVRILETRINGLLNEKNEAIRAAKSWQRKFEKLEKEQQARTPEDVF